MVLKVLVISEEGFSSLSGGGVLKKNLFAINGAYEILSLEDPLDNQLDVNCKKFLITKYIIRSRNLQLFKYIKGAKNNATHKSSDNSNFLNLVCKKIIKLMVGNASHPTFLKKLDSKILKIVDDFNPSVIYTTLGSYGLNQLVLRMRKRFDIPMVVHIMDDWISATNTYGLFAFIFGWAVRRQFKKILSLASRLYVISYDMKIEYESRYGFEFSVLHNGVEDTRIIQNQKKIDGRIIKIGYVGTLLANVQLNGIGDLIKAMNQINQVSADYKFKLFMYISPSSFEYTKSVISESDTLVLKVAPSGDDDYYQLLESMHILFVPAPFNTTGFNYTKFSVPAKLPSYLASNSRILGYGPAGSTQIKMLPKEFCTIVNIESVMLLHEALADIKNALISGSIGLVEQYEYTKNNYSLNKIQCKFHNDLMKL